MDKESCSLQKLTVEVRRPARTDSSSSTTALSSALAGDSSGLTVLCFCLDVAFLLATLAYYEVREPESSKLDIIWFKGAGLFASR
jgi:hypothetical protein